MVIIILRLYYCCVLPGNRPFRLDSSCYMHICMFRNMAFFRVSLLSVFSSQLFYNHSSYNNLYIEGNVNFCCEHERFSIDCCESDASNRRHDCCHIFYCLVLKELSPESVQTSTICPRNEVIVFNFKLNLYLHGLFLR